VVDAMKIIAELAFEARECLVRGDWATLGHLMNRNFDIRRGIYRLNPKHIRMVELAREIGASSKFAGSGGSIIGIYKDEEMFERLKKAFEAESCSVIKPVIQ
jgi:glucuronokinase